MHRPSGLRQLALAGILLLQTTPAPAANCLYTGVNILTRIDPASGAVTYLTREDLAFVAGLVSSADGRLVYIARVVRHSQECDTEGAVSIFDIATQHEVATIPLARPGHADAIALSPDGRWLYVTDNLLSKVFVVNLNNNIAVADIDVPAGYGYCPEGIDQGAPSASAVIVSPDGRFAYAAANTCNIGCGGSFTVIDTASLSAQPFPISDVTNLAFTADGAQLYATINGRLSIIDTTTHVVAATIDAVGGGSVAVAPNGWLYVTNANGLTVFDPATATVVAEVRLPVSLNVVLDPPAARAYVTTRGDVVAIDTNANAEVQTFVLDAGSRAIAIADCGPPAPSPTATTSLTPTASATPTPSLPPTRTVTEQPSPTPAGAHSDSTGCAIDSHAPFIHPLLAGLVLVCLRRRAAGRAPL